VECYTLNWEHEQDHNHPIALGSQALEGLLDVTKEPWGVVGLERGVGICLAGSRTGVGV